MKTKVAWAISALLLCVIVYMAHLLAVRPKVVVRDVPQVTTREVVKEVPTEVIKEVPRDVIREVPVEKVVEKPVPEPYVAAYDFMQYWQSPVQAADASGSLRGVKTFSVSVSVSDLLKPSVSTDALRNKIELELRKLGATVTDDGPVNVTFGLYAVKDAELPLIVYSGQLSVNEFVVIPRPPPYLRTNVITWTQGYYGSVGIDNAGESAGTYFDGLLTALLNDYIKANPPTLH